MTEAPITYNADFLDGHNRAEYFDLIWSDLPWEQRDGAPRRECWLNPYGLAYTYGTGDYARTYEAHAMPLWADNQAISLIAGIMLHLNNDYSASFDCCFINGYESGKQHLGWHADDSPEMDHDHPIAVVSLGAERDIMFRQAIQWDEPLNRLAQVDGWYPPVKQLLGNGSLLLMNAGMQRNWQHRIPKSSVHDCGARLSLTFRKLVFEKED